MDSDIKLSGTELFIEGDVLRIKAHDLILDNEERRDEDRKDPKEQRRALVHFGDTLIINFDKDYPHGVTIEGRVRFPGVISDTVRIEDTLFIRAGGKIILESRTIKPGSGKLPVDFVIREVNLQDELTELRAKTEELQEQINKLKSHP